jgi:hypothetical protein
MIAIGCVIYFALLQCSHALSSNPVIGATNASEGIGSSGSNGGRAPASSSGGGNGNPNSLTGITQGWQVCIIGIPVCNNYH